MCYRVVLAYLFAACHSRESGNPEVCFVLDSRFRGNDRKDYTREGIGVLSTAGLIYISLILNLYKNKTKKPIRKAN
ncbi:MAG: hypothetical protein A3B25_01775 [Candidatus Ryanbacteria bacterium RIFCSPLOWO2_01_FULL_48_26]|uniref:Uncharacterized protein n=1 Tax=Candidatus Ryanbacteria bacterium RIFCSPLOWO2_01_FULL_48_26 TaxID=1802126 RepID=A0A1G2GVX9_9BACT|nr:MAG: hypothetical protein A3B25_01775 [Candidatus Ryanbacteria bacterium RIFCSPLOWO2_01_FULL_48_26]